MTKRVALVIGSGSVKCAAALGLWNVLQREGIAVDMLVGCSGGSIYAACLASGMSVDEVRELSARLWTREATSIKDRKALLRVLFPRLFKFDAEFGLRDDRLILRNLRQGFGTRTFASMKIPLHITATDFLSGEQVIISNGSVADAVRASIAIPFILKPWTIDGRLCVDGFVSDPMPVGAAMREGADLIIAMGFESPMQTKINSAARFAFQLSSVMTNNILKSNFAFHNLAHHAEVIPIIPQFAQRIRLFDTDKVPYIIEEGERAAEAQVPYLRRLLDANAVAQA